MNVKLLSAKNNNMAEIFSMIFGYRSSVKMSFDHDSRKNVIFFFIIFVQRLYIKFSLVGLGLGLLGEFTQASPGCCGGG